MPADPGYGVRSITKRRRLNVGQGVPGGGRALPNLPESATSTDRTRVRSRPTVSTRATPQPGVGSPAGFALSLPRPVASNRPVSAQPEYAGAALLRRGSFLQQIQPYGTAPEQTNLSKKDHRVLDLLESPDQKFNPRKHAELQLILRPGPALAAAIELDPKLQKNRAEILAHVQRDRGKLPAQSLVAALERQVGTGKMSFAEFSRKYDKQLSNLSPDEQQRFASRVYEVQDHFEQVEAAGVLASVGTGVKEGSFLSNLAKDWASLVTGFIPGTVQAVKDPIKTGKAVAENYAYAYGPAVQGDFGELASRFQDHPLGYMLDASGVGSVAVGVGGRTAAAASAVATAKKATEIASNMARVTRKQILEKPTAVSERIAQRAEALGDADMASMIRGQKFKSVDDLEVFLKENAGSNAKPLLNDFRNAPKSKGVTMVGDQFAITPSATGMWEIRRNGKFVAINLPTERAAIEHAQQIATGLSGDALRKLTDPDKSMAKAAIHGFTHPEMYDKTRGAWIDWYEAKRGEQHTAELEIIADEVASVLDDPNLRLDKRTLGQVIEDTKADVTKAYREYQAGPETLRKQDPQMMKGKVAPKLVTGAAQSYKEAMALIRLGAIYLRPAYIPNNWAGNTFMNMVHQGGFAPVNLAKTLVISKHMDPRYRVAMQRAMGEHAAGAVYHGAEGTMIGAAGAPFMQAMGRVADIPFREAAFLHEARRMGYRKLSEVNRLFDDAAKGNQMALDNIAKMGRRAQEEIVKFGRLSHAEKQVFQQVFFVYNWVRGAMRYGTRFPMQHPIQTAAGNALAQVGNEWVESELGGLPWFMLGSIPVGRTKDGEPILINPFALNPLGTLADLTRAAIGTAKVITGEPGTFDKFSDTDIVDMTHPLIQEFLRAREGTSRGFGREIAESIAPIRLAHRLQNPNTGGIYPTDRKEAVGGYVLGSLYPRRASQEGISKALEREHRNDPVSLLPRQVKQVEKALGEKLDDAFIGQLKGDLEAVQDLKKFKRGYADDHGGHGFENLPAENQAEAAIIFAQQNGFLTNDEADELTRELPGLPDTVLNDLANAIFRSTGIGETVEQWNKLKKATQAEKKTPRK